MNSSKMGDPDQAAPLVGLIAIVAGTLGLFFWVEPLKTFRPSGQHEPRPPLEFKQPSRLWQDPIQQARESVARTASGAAQGQVAGIPVPGKAEEVRVVAVTVAGGYGQQDHETRLRSRYAVALALGEHHYAPDGEDTEYLRFLAVNWQDDSDKPPGEVAPVSRKVVPFEWWKETSSSTTAGERKRPGQVLVLWIDDAFLGSKPRKNLRKLLAQTGIPREHIEELRMIGPTSSSGLKDLIEDQEEDDRWPKEIDSPWATADEVFLFGKNENVQALRLPKTIHRTIATDREACGLLIRELEARGIRLRGGGAKPDRIALLAEFDTVYGRALPLTFAGCVLTNAKGSRCDEETGVEEFRKEVQDLLKGGEWPEELFRVRYLRGLDGMGPYSPEQDKLEEKEAKPTLADLERPDGPSQLDYARRLAEKVTWTQSGSVRAVGVLGGDVYDKLLLLQALRGRLPGVFFTTDLDAAYLHPSQNSWSRNLIVASSSGLWEGSWSGPPLRDTYGVAIGRAVTRAVLTGEQSDMVPAAKLFEIGRTAAHRLPPGVSDGGEPKEWGRTVRIALWVLTLLLLAGVLLMMHMGQPALRLWMAALGLLVVILAMLRAGATSEPLLWLEGVSIWPTEVIRLISTAGVAVVLLRVGNNLRSNLEELTEHYGLSVPHTEPGDWKTRWLRAWQQLLAEAPKPDEQGTVEAQRLWACYGSAEQSWARWWRSGTLAGVLLAVMATSLFLERPMRPCRGTSCGIDAVVAVMSIAGLLLLTCYVADATATCTRWIRCMSERRTTWPGSQEGSQADLPGGWHEVELAARRTQLVGQLILYPFGFLLLLIVARFPVFDDWPWPISLVIVFTLLLGLALLSALALRSSAEQLRGKSYAEVRALWTKTLRNKELAELHETAMKSIEAESRGAFSPFTRNPALAAVMLPLGGAGTGLALEKLLQNL